MADQFDQQGNFLGRIKSVEEAQFSDNPITTEQAAASQFQQPTGQGFPGLEASQPPAPERTDTENRLEMAKTAVKAESAAEEGGDGFRFTDIFDVLGSMASDKTIAADSLGRLVGKATGEKFVSSEQRENAREVQKQQAKQAMGLLLEQGRDRRAENRLNFTKEKFGENKDLRKQDREIAKTRVKLAKTKGERLERQAGLDQLDREADTDALADTILVGANKTFSGGSAKAIAEKLKISRDAASQMLNDIAALPAAERKEAAEQLAERFSPSGREQEQQTSAPEGKSEDEIVTLGSGRRFNRTTKKFLD